MQRYTYDGRGTYDEGGGGGPTGFVAPAPQPPAIPQPATNNGSTLVTEAGGTTTTVGRAPGTEYLSIVEAVKADQRAQQAARRQMVRTTRWQTAIFVLIVVLFLALLGVLIWLAVR